MCPKAVPIPRTIMTIVERYCDISRSGRAPAAYSRAGYRQSHGREQR